VRLKKEEKTNMNISKFNS